MARETAAGQVTWSGSKKVGKRTFYSLKLDDGEFYRTGLEDSGLSKGDLVQFQYETVENNGYTNHEIVPGTIVPLEEEVKTTAKAASKAYTKPAGKFPAKKETGKDDYWEQRAANDIENQRRISYQAATNTAVAVCNKLLELDKIGIGTAKNKQLDTYLEIVNKTTDHFFHKYQAIGQTDALTTAASESDQDDDNVNDQEVSDD